jgi:hypothetical protein
MSATEIIEELEKMPIAEQERIFAFLLDARNQRKATEVRYAPDAEFEKVADEVFREHADLFRRLAK